ncbi:MAG TPA: Smr/MutS family protein [Gammaproteobacteria bacterium]|nr:Smr/MutS family protein [Gammaproteobacteria bacterium]
MNKPKKPALSDEETTLFRDAMKGVSPLTHTKIPSPKKSLPPRVRPVIKEQIDEGVFFSDNEHMDPVESEDFLLFSRSGVQQKVLRKMRQGQYNAEAHLDLHGKTIDEARESLARFLLQCQHDKIRTILIIHGKGKDGRLPVLKNKLNNWLRQTEQVIAFCSAIPKQGGSGALIVLLRRER